jgi:hypothetical protein
MGKRELREKKKALREEKRNTRKRHMEYKMANFVSHRVPPGYDWEKELSWVRGALICAVIFGSFLFLIRLGVGISNLYEQKWEPAANGGYVSAGIVLKEDAVMREVSVLLAQTRVGFALTGVLLVVMVVSHYRYYRQGSMSIYLMKRLPNGREYHRRNFSFVLILAAVSLAVMLVMSLTHYGMYLLFTPKGCLPNGHGLNFWRWMIGGGL